MNNRFTDIANSSPVVDLVDRQNKIFPRSKFDFSNSKILNANFGTIIPIDLIHTLPNEDYEISYDLLALTRNPTIRRVLSGCRLYVHTVYQPESHLWEGALNQKTGGRSGNIQLEKPYLKYKGTYNSSPDVVLDWRTPNSLLDYLGLPIVYYNPDNPLLSYLPVNPDDENVVKVGKDYSTRIDALPFVMYQRLCRDMFFNANLLYNNKELYPDNEYHFILPYNATEVFQLSYTAPNGPIGSSSVILNFEDGNSRFYVPSNTNERVLLTTLHYRQFRGDMFTSALPFPDLIRGDAPVLDFNSISAVNENDVVTAFQGGKFISSFTPNDVYKFSAEGGNNKGVLGMDVMLFDGATLDDITDMQKKIYSVKVKDIASKLVGQYVSLADLRSLLVYSIIKQKNALTSGDYNDLVKAHFGVSPKHHNFQHHYIGGFYSDLVYNEVFQTSESGTTPLGTTAGRGVTAQSGYIGKFHSDDYGYIMTVLTIVPEVYYHQGINRNLTKLTRDDVYLPESNELSPQAILNQEVYASEDENYNNDVFGYTERNIEYKYRNNEVHGLSAVGSQAEYDNALLQKRTFSNKVYLNNDFVTMSPKNIDMSIMSSIDEPPFDIVVKSRVEKVSPIPYVSIPGGLDMSLV